MSVPSIILWVLAVVLWLYALVPLMRLKRYLNQQRREGLTPPKTSDVSRMRAILSDVRHPLHRDARRMMLAYGGFLFCWIVGFGLTFAAKSPH